MSGNEFPSAWRRRLAKALEEQFHAAGLPFERVAARGGATFWAFVEHGRRIGALIQTMDGAAVRMEVRASGARWDPATHFDEETYVFSSSVPLGLYRAMRKLDPPEAHKALSSTAGWFLYGSFREDAFFWSEAQIDLYIRDYMPRWVEEARAIVREDWLALPITYR